MINAESLAKILLIPTIESCIKHSGNELGDELFQLLTKNLLVLESDNWQSKVERAYESGEKQIAQQGETLDDFTLVQLRYALISVLRRNNIGQL